MFVSKKVLSNLKQFIFEEILSKQICLSEKAVQHRKINAASSCMQFTALKASFLLRKLLGTGRLMLFPQRGGSRLIMDQRKCRPEFEELSNQTISVNA